MKKEHAVTLKVYRSELIKLTVGHITLETYPRETSNGIYVDFRPVDHKESVPVAGGVIKKKSPSGRPDMMVHLYGLNIDAIEAVWASISSQNRITWGLLSKFKTNTERSVCHNSASLCLLLLYFGGITNSHHVQLSNTCSWLFAWCESGLKTVIHSLSTVAIGTSAGAELLARSSVEQKAAGALMLLPILKESVTATASEAGIFAQKTAEIFSVTPGEVEELLMSCKKHQDESMEIKKHSSNLLVDTYSTDNCLIL